MDLGGGFDGFDPYTLAALRVDGGASLNNFLMQFQADILDVPVERPASVETTAWGAAALAGVNAGLFNFDALLDLRRVDAEFSPKWNPRHETSYKQAGSGR